MRTILIRTQDCISDALNAWWQDEVGKGAFQELDQVAVARQLCKFAARATSAAAVPGVIQQAFEVNRPV